MERMNPAQVRLAFQIAHLAINDESMADVFWAAIDKVGFKTDDIANLNLLLTWALLGTGSAAEDAIGTVQDYDKMREDITKAYAQFRDRNDDGQGIWQMFEDWHDPDMLRELDSKSDV